MKSLVLLAALLLVGCSVEVDHDTKNRAQTESLSTSHISKTAVALSVLNESSPESRHTDESATPSVQRSTTIVKVIVPEPTPEVVTPPPPLIARCPEPTIRVTGSRNTVILGDVHIHRHEHKHFHKMPEPTPVRVEVRIEVDDRISERERRRRIVQRQISNVFPHYRD